MTSDLHIPNLTIKNFRGIDHLEIPKFGRVTLIVGRNGVGKTTVLDAIRVYAARGDIPVLWEVLQSHDEMVRVVDEGGDLLLEPDWPALFHDRDDSRQISMCSNVNGLPRALTIAPEEAEGEIEGEVPDLGVGLRISFDAQERDVPWLIWPGPAAATRMARTRDRRRYLQGLRRRDESSWPFPKLVVESLGPHIPNNEDLARYWDEITLTDAEKVAFEALALASGVRIRGAAVVADRGNFPRAYGGRLVVGISGSDERVPLRRLGEGSIRLFGLALAMVNCKGGLLLIDEIENGIHYGIMADMWKIVLELAQRNDVQVIATTHGWDCVWSLAGVALSDPTNELVALRIQQDKQRLGLVEFDNDDFAEIAEHNLEIR